MKLSISQTAYLRPNFIHRSLDQVARNQGLQAAVVEQGRIVQVLITSRVSAKLALIPTIIIGTG